MTVNYFCLRYVLLGCFILLGVSGVIVCAAGSFFVYQLHENNYGATIIDNAEGPPAILLSMGLLTCALAIYFWFVMDYKYNRPQFIMFSLMLLLVSITEACAGVWALVKHEQLDAMLSSSLEETLTVPKIKDTILTLNFTHVKLSCCGYNNETVPAFEERNSWSCCDFGRLDNETRFVCEDLHGKECRHLIINRNRSVLHHVFLLALCSVILQIFVATSIMCYTKFLKKQRTRRGRRSAVGKASAP